MAKTEAPQQLDTLVARLEALVGRTTELVETTRGLALNHVLFSGTRTIPAAGYVELATKIPMASVAIGALAATGTVTAAAEPPDGQAPSDGPGVIVVPAGWHVVAPLTGVTLTIWGTAGDRIHVVALSRVVPPTAGAGGAIGGTP